MTQIPIHYRDLLGLSRLAMLLAALGLTPLTAQALRNVKPRPAGVDNTTLVERLSLMPVEQRNRLLERMAPERRALIEKRLEQYNAIKPEDQIRLKKDYEDFQNLPPEKQAEARRIFREISDLEPPRRQQVRAAINRLRPFTGVDLERRMTSRVFLERFGAKERVLIRQALAVLPTTAKEDPSEEHQ